jgi:hypothetical protein
MTPNPRHPLRREVRALGAVRNPLRTALNDAGLGHATLTTEASPAEVDYIVYAPTAA